MGKRESREPTAPANLLTGGNTHGGASVSGCHFSVKSQPERPGDFSVFICQGGKNSLAFPNRPNFDRHLSELSVKTPSTTNIKRLTIDRTRRIAGKKDRHRGNFIRIQVTTKQRS